MATLPLSYVPRALAARDTQGLIKLVANAKSARLLGAHILAQEGGEVIQTAAMALREEMRVIRNSPMNIPFYCCTWHAKEATQYG